jgi:ligand-binding SRPBCC domain-containing protein
MHVYERSILIKAACQDVFDFHLDPQNLPKITPGFISVKILQAGPPGLGQEVILRLTQFGIPAGTMHMKFTEFEYPFRLSDTQLKGPFKKMFQRRIFTDIGDGYTRLTDRFEYELPLGLLGRLAQKILVGRMIEQMFVYRQNALRKFLETES